jgi:hypothetical protein
MATKKSKALPIEVLLDAKLSTLQDSCVHEMKMHSQTRQQERENLAQIYYWWQEAYKLPAYYQAKLAHLPPEQRRNTTDKFNFGPVLRLFYGVYGLEDYKRSRLSSALNAMHEEWEAKPKLYKQDVVKLANFIDQSKGVTGLAMQRAKIAPAASHVDEIHTAIQLEEHEAKQAAMAATSSDDDDADPSYELIQHRKRLDRPVHVEVTDAQRKDALLDDAQEYWRKASGIASYDLGFGLEANKRKYSLALVRVDGDKMEVINSSVDEDAIKTALLASYREQFASVPINLRCLLEALRTQYIGGKAAEQLAKVAELGLPSDDDDIEDEQPTVATRMIFISASNQILLSPVNSNAGLVTVATPTKQLINVVGNDFLLPAYSRVYLERRLICNDDINQFSVTNTGKLMAMHKAPSIVYTMKLTNKAMPADFAYIDIVSFSASKGKAKRDSQLTLNEKYIASIKTKFKINAHIMHKLAKQYADKWLALKGDHANRAENDLCTFAVTANAFEFEIFDKAGDVASDPVCTHGAKLKLAKQYKCYFKCRDLMAALSGIGALQLQGEVEMLLDGNVLAFKYCTDAASYISAIPTYNDKTEQRNENAFVTYTATPYTSNAAAASHVQPVNADALMPIYCYA